MRRFLLSAAALVCVLLVYADKATTTYQNPIIYQDYSDPDVIRVGEHYWMTASSFQCWPGLPILHSFDLVHWDVVNHALRGAIPGGVGATSVEHGNQVWAPSIRFHSGLYYIMWGDPDKGIYEVHTKDPAYSWSEPRLVIEAKGYIDACPFWDEDGRTYIVHALANSRAGMKSVLLLTETDERFTKVINKSKIIFDGHTTQPTCEGPKMYKKDGYYYIFFPAGGVATGWQTVIRSKSLDVWDDSYDQKMWEEKVVMRQGKTKINGPHQGGWVTTPGGEDWFIHFQDVGALGRILHLQPMKWTDGWPVIGVDEDGDGCGEPVLEYNAPTVSKAQVRLMKKSTKKKFRIGYFASGLADIREWQWQRAPRDGEATDHEKMNTGDMVCRQEEGGDNLWQQQMVLEKISGPDAEYTTQIIFRPKEIGDRFGMIIMGLDYAGLDLRLEDDGSCTLNYITCENADKGKKEKVEPITGWINQVDRYTVKPVEKQQIFLRVSIHSENALASESNTDKHVTATFSYSTDSEHYTVIPGVFRVKEGKWIGAKVGFFCTSKKPSEGKCKILSLTKK